MKTIVLDAAEGPDPQGARLRESLLAELEQAGCEVEVFHLGEEEIDSCRGCFGCWTKSPGLCTIDDAGRQIAKAVVCSDLAVFVTPVTFGGYSSLLKRVVDRLIPVIAPLFLRIEEEGEEEPCHHCFPRLLGLGILSREDEEAARLFQTLVRHNAENFHCRAHAAGVVMPGERGMEVRIRIRNLLQRVGVDHAKA
jgi:hypothetical protein